MGLGVGEQHARAYARLRECRLHYVYDLDQDRARAVAHNLGSTVQVADSFERLLDDDRVDILSLASFDDHHSEQVLAALQSGKHVFVEKPMCRSVSDAQRIKEAWAASGTCHLASNLVLRGAALYRWLRGRIQRGDLGRVYAVDGDYLYGRLHKITEEWRKDVRDYSVMQGGGIHLADLMIWLTGERPRRVAARGNRICTEGTKFRYMDYVCAEFEFDSGMIGRVTANFGCVHRHQHVLRVFGTAATFVYDDAGARWHDSRDPDRPPLYVEENPLPTSKGVLIPHFVGRIVRGEDPAPAAQCEFDLVCVVAAADMASATRDNVEVQYV